MAAWGGDPVPLDDGVHWARIGEDIMSARIHGSQVATAVTLGAMADIGYIVDGALAGR